MVMLLHCNEPTGSRVYDYSMMNNNGTGYNILTPTSSALPEYGLAKKFGGGPYSSCGYIDFGDRDAYSFLDEEFTISFFVWANEVSANDQYILCKGGSGVGQYEYAVVLNPAGKIRVTLWQQYGANCASCTTSRSVSDGVWHEAHIVANRPAGYMRVYLDGSQDASTTGFTGDMADTNAQLEIGRRGDSGEGFKGKLDEVRIIDTAIDVAPYTPTPIYSLTPTATPHATNTPQPFEVAPDGSTMGLWHMDELSGVAVTDSSGRGHVGAAGAAVTIAEGDLNLGHCRHFPGGDYDASKYIDFGDHDDFSFTHGCIAFEFRMKDDSGELETKPMYVAVKGDSSNYEYGILYLQDTGQLEFGFWTYSGALIASAQTQGIDLGDGHWHEVRCESYRAGTSSTIGKIEIWVDGKRHAESSRFTSGIIENKNARFLFGHRQDNPSWSVLYKGYLDEVRLSRYYTPTPGVTQSPTETPAPTETPTLTPTWNPSVPTYTPTLTPPPTITPTPTETPTITPTRGPGWFPLNDSAWPITKRDVYRRGQSEYNGPQSFSWAWSYVLKGVSEKLASSPVITGAAVYYLAHYNAGSGDSRSYNDGTMYCYSRNGDAHSLRWSYNFGPSPLCGSPYKSSPVIDSSGSCYFGTRRADLNISNLWCLTGAGGFSWSYRVAGAGDHVQASIDSANRMVAAAGDLYCIGSDGALSWSYDDVNTHLREEVALDEEGRIYAGSEDNRMYAFSSAGTLVWSYATNAPTYRRGFAVGRNTAYCGSGPNDWNLYAIRKATGRLRWSYSVSHNDGVYIGEYPSVDTDDNVYMGEDGGWRYYCILSTGRLSWSYMINPSSDGGPRHPPVLGANRDSFIICGDNDPKLWCISSSGVKKWEYDIAPSYVAPALTERGQLYITGEYQRDMALVGPTGVPTATPTITPTPTNTPPPTPTPRPDTDGDGWKDEDELSRGTDPLNPESYPSPDIVIFLPEEGSHV